MGEQKAGRRREGGGGVRISAKRVFIGCEARILQTLRPVDIQDKNGQHERIHPHRLYVIVYYLSGIINQS